MPSMWFQLFFARSATRFLLASCLLPCSLTLIPKPFPRFILPDLVFVGVLLAHPRQSCLLCVSPLLRPAPSGSSVFHSLHLCSSPWPNSLAFFLSWISIFVLPHLQHLMLDRTCQNQKHHFFQLQTSLYHLALCDIYSNQSFVSSQVAVAYLFLLLLFLYFLLPHHLSPLLLVLVQHNSH